MKALDKLKNLIPFKKPDVKKEVTEKKAMMYRITLFIFSYKFKGQ